MYLGTWQIDDVLTFYLNTLTAATGAATDASSGPTYRVYEDEASTPILTGTMALLDSTNTAGFYSEQIALTSANGFEVGKQYAIYMEWVVALVTQATHHTFQVEHQAIITSAATTVNAAATSATLTTGTQSSGTYTNTSESNNTRHVIADSAGALDLYYEFGIGGDGIANTVSYEGYVNGANDTISVYARNWGSSAWEQIGSIVGKNQSADDMQQWLLTTAHTGTGANLGLVRIRFLGSGLTSATLNTDRLLVGYAIITRSVGYAEGAVWLDTSLSNTSTELFVSGTADNPVSALAAARTIAIGLGIRRIRVMNGSSITLADAYNNYTFVGANWTLALGGQDISGCVFDGATVSGVGTGTLMRFANGTISNVTVPIAVFDKCWFTGTLTMSAAASFSMLDCSDRMASGATPIIDFGAHGAGSLTARKWAGGIEIRNMATGDLLSIDGNGRVVIAASCTGGEVRIRGAWDLQNDGDGVIIADLARWNKNQVGHDMRVGR